LLILTLVYWLLAAATAGSLVYCCIALYAAVRFANKQKRWRIAATQAALTPPVSLLKPLYGLDRELEESLRSFCIQDYPAYEILFHVREDSDPAVAVVRRLEHDRGSGA
jgi:ceramide glucosyltransferase